jgi:hypothetical protein
VIHRNSIARWLGRGVFLGCLLLPWLLLAQVSVSLNRSTIAVGESAMLTVSIQSSDLESAPQVPPVDGLNITQSSASQSVSIVNGVRTVSIKIGYTLSAAREGEFTIGPVKVRAGGSELKSQTVVLKVTAATNPSSPQSVDMSKAAFIQLQTTKQEVYLGEVFSVEMNLYFQNAQAEMPQMKTDGFSLSSPPLHTRGQVRLPNGDFQQHTFRQSAKALKTGDMELGPAQSKMEVKVPVEEVDPFFGNLIRRYRSFPLTVKSDVVKLKVLPLPEAGRPDSFNGAIGKFNFRATAAKHEVAVGDPVILQVAVTGMGTWDSVQLPPMDGWRDFKIYPPNSEFKPLDDLGIQGVKNFELVVVPENSGVKEIPAMSFSFFDTDARQYQTIKLAAIPLKVHASSGAPVQPTITSGEVKPDANEPAPAKDILHIKPHFGTAVSLATPALGSPWFWTVNTFPLLGWAILVFWRKQTERAARDPRAQRARTVAQSEAEGLGQLAQLAAAGSSKEFFDLLAKVLQERLGERLDMPASVITEAVIEEQLAPAGAGEELRQELHALFQACNQARYAPVSDVAKLDALVEKARAALIQLAAMEVKR